MKYAADGVKSEKELEFEVTFSAARDALHRVLSSDYRGTVGGALQIGNAAAMALNVIDGHHWIDAGTYKLRRVK